MLDTVEFQKAKKRVFENKDSLHNLSILESYINDLELVCINERSFELAEILSELIKDTESFANPETHFKLLTLYFQQIYQYMQNLDEAKQIIEKMSSIAEETQNVEHIAYTSLSNSIISRIVGSIKESNEYIHNAMETIKSAKSKYPDIYHRILYTDSHFSWMEDTNQPEAVENVEKCVKYWYSTQNTLPMVTGIFQLLRYYSILGNEQKFNELISWVFNEEKVQEKILDSHFTILYSFVGRIYAIKSQITEAINYLQEAYDRVKKTNSQEKLMYEFIENQKILCRSYAFLGLYEKSYAMLVEFLSYIESDFVRKNYYESRIKKLYFSVYYTLLFIYVQLDVSISGIEDKRLLRIHNYVKDLIEQSQISRDLLLDTTLDEKELSLIDKEKSSKPDELFLNLYQQLISLETYSADEKTIDQINLIRDYVFNPLYADVVIGKIHLTIGDFENFNILVKRLENQINKADSPILQLWIQLFSLLNQFIENPEDSKLIVEIQKIEDQCKANKYFKMADEVSLYLKLLKSSLTVEEQNSRFQRAVFLDLYNRQSRKMVVEILDQKESQKQ